MEAPIRVYLLVFFLCSVALSSAAPYEDEDCELHTPNTMHEFCCDIHDENVEFMECHAIWGDQIEPNTPETEKEHSFCVSECVYNKTEYLKPDRKSLRMNLIRRHLEELHADDESEQLMYTLYERCDKHAAEMLEHAEVKKIEKRLEKHGCHPYPGLVFECISNELILNCPDKKYHNTAACDDTRAFLKVCLNRK